MTVLLAATGSAFAAGAGGGGNATDSGAMGSGAAANGVHPAPTQGVEQGMPATGSTHGMKTSKTTRHHRKHAQQKTINDTTNIPGADASSDTKGR